MTTYKCPHCLGSATKCNDGVIQCNGAKGCEFSGSEDEFEVIEDTTEAWLTTRISERWLATKRQRFVIDEVIAERTRQDAKFGGPEVDDRRKTELDWVEDIEAYTAWAKQMCRMGSPEKHRRRMMQIAALAVAACESFDRHNARY